MLGGLFFKFRCCVWGGVRIERAMAQKVHCWGMGVLTRAMMVGWEGVVE